MGEETSISGRSRTPLPGDVPLLQYLFNTAITEETQRSILIILTPRRPANPGALVEANFYWAIRMPSNLLKLYTYGASLGTPRRQ
ncbi:MAG: hypothetical protein Q8O25_07005 [Sulfurisoma sp.]|nr:hypothetical protein [Sulfurisoma sp.]